MRNFYGMEAGTKRGGGVWVVGNALGIKWFVQEERRLLTARGQVMLVSLLFPYPVGLEISEEKMVVTW